MAANSSFAVVISLAKAHDQGHPSIVSCLKCTYDAKVDKFRPYGVPFRLYADGNRFTISDKFLSDQEIKEGTVIETFSGCYFSENTGIQLEVSEIIRHLKFNDNADVVVFRGIADAFPEATILERGISQNNPLRPSHRYALISVLRAVTVDSRIIALTRLKEKVKFKNRSMNCHKNSSGEAFKVPIRQPVSDEDVGDVILIALGSKPTKEGVCEGILLSARSSDEDSPSPISESQFYKMESRPRGFCLIFNNMSFKDKNLDRLGANFDEQKLCDLFKKLQFKVCLCKDVDRHRMEQICTHFGSKDHSQYDAFVCIIMSHGTSGDKIMGVDGRTIGVEDLMSEFNAVRCPSLADKPKIFLVQACRGPEFLSPTVDQQIADSTFSDSTLSRSRLPKESDFLLAYGSVPGYVSYRMPNSGSLFIQNLVDVFENKHHKDHLEDMLIEVRRRVSGAACQVSPSHTSLRYKVLL